MDGEAFPRGKLPSAVVYESAVPTKIVPKDDRLFGKTRVTNDAAPPNASKDKERTRAKSSDDKKKERAKSETPSGAPAAAGSSGHGRADELSAKVSPMLKQRELPF
jgi:hypothetical protein